MSMSHAAATALGLEIAVVISIIMLSAIIVQTAIIVIIIAT